MLESRRGTTSHQLNPWFTLDPEGTATEEAGELWSGALAWSGSWKLVFETNPGGRVHACGGVNDFDWAYRLEPGDELVLPRFAGLHTTGGFRRGQPRMARLAAGARPRARGRPPRPGRRPGAGRPGATAPVTGRDRGEPPLRPVLYNSWEATTFQVSEAGQARLAELAARLGIECFVMDDGWFGGRHNDRAGLGDWTVNRGKFPRGLGPLIERVNEPGHAVRAVGRAGDGEPGQ